MAKFKAGDRIVMKQELGTVADFITLDPYQGNLYEVVLDWYTAARMYAYEHELKTIDEACEWLRKELGR